MRISEKRFPAISIFFPSVPSIEGDNVNRMVPRRIYSSRASKWGHDDSMVDFDVARHGAVGRGDVQIDLRFVVCRYTVLAPHRHSTISGMA